MCAAASSLGLQACLGELAYQLVPRFAGLAVALACFFAGAAAGLWLPRHYIRRQLRTRAELSTTEQNKNAASELVSSLIGGLALVVALGWTLLAVLTLCFEDYRDLLSVRFLHPLMLKTLLLAAPLYLGLLLVGAASTTALIALHGWQRLATYPHTHVARLWVALLSGGLAGATAALLLDSIALCALAAPLLTFAAAALAVLRPTPATPVPAARLDEPLIDEHRLWLVLIGVTATIIAVAIRIALTLPVIRPENAAAILCILLLSALSGVLLTRGLHRFSTRTEAAPFMLLLSAVFLVLPGRFLFVPPPAQPALRLVLITLCATIAIALCARRLALHTDSIQFSLSWTGRIVAGALGLALLLLVLLAAEASSNTIAALASLIATGTAGLLFILESRLPTRPRLAGLALVVVWIMLIPASAVSQPTEPPIAELPQRSLSVVARERNALRDTLIADSFEYHTLALPTLDAVAADCWQFDLSGPRYDLLIIEPSIQPETTILDTAFAQRLLNRAQNSLSVGGRLIIELPAADGLLETLLETIVESPDPFWQGYRVCVESPSTTPATELCLAIAFGRDLPDLVARRNRVADLPVYLKPLQERETNTGGASQR